MKNIPFVLLLTCLFIMPATVIADYADGADQYWVVGSFENKTEAINEGERLSGVTGVEVMMLPLIVDNNQIYRLLIRLFPDSYDQERLMTQLRYASVDGVWKISLTGGEPGLRSLFAVIDYNGEVLGSTGDNSLSRLDKMPDPVFAESMMFDTGETENYLVAGSFRDARFAASFRSTLSEVFDSTTIRDSELDGLSYYRVLVGPVDEDSEAEIIRQAYSAGIENPWILRDVPFLSAIPQYPSTSVAVVSSTSVSTAHRSATRGTANVTNAEIVAAEPTEYRSENRRRSARRSATSSSKSDVAQTSRDTSGYNLARLNAGVSPFLRPPARK
ncbi:MAG: hypothetical protein VB957_12235 [Pseudomonadales bacterium]